MKVSCWEHGDQEAEPTSNGDVFCPECLKKALRNPELVRLAIDRTPGYPGIATAVSMGCRVAVAAPATGGVSPDSFAEESDEPEEEENNDCPDCQGTGIGNPNMETRCPVCYGTGVKKYQQEEP